MIAAELENKYGLPVEFGEDEELSQRQAANSQSFLVPWDEPDWDSDFFNELYCEAANTAYAQVIERRATPTGEVDVFSEPFKLLGDLLPD